MKKSTRDEILLWSLAIALTTLIMAALLGSGCGTDAPTKPDIAPLEDDPDGFAWSGGQATYDGDRIKGYVIARATRGIPRVLFEAGYHPPSDYRGGWSGSLFASAGWGSKNPPGADFSLPYQTFARGETDTIFFDSWDTREDLSDGRWTVVVSAASFVDTPPLFMGESKPIPIRYVP